MESKYELYKTACKNIEAKIVSVLKLPNFPLCKGVKIEEVDDTVNSTVKAHFAGVYFDFMCNMKEIEFLGAINWKKLIESFGDDLDECPQKIDKTDSSGMQYPDFCR